MDQTNVSMEELHKEIDLVQGCITRMAQNSFMITRMDAGDRIRAHCPCGGPHPAGGAVPGLYGDHTRILDAGRVFSEDGKVLSLEV